MRLFNHHFLRIFVVMLVAMFVVNTVYAGSMMVSASSSILAVNSAAQTHNVSEDVELYHCHDHGQAGLDQPYSDHEPQPHAGSHCHHCLACYSVILNSHLDTAALRSLPVMAAAPNVLYLAPVNPQPSKPPIL